MALIHMDETAGNGQPFDAPPLNDPQIALAARMVARFNGGATGSR
jgi:hypothetical protein